MSSDLPPDPGWRVFERDPMLASWLDHIRPHAQAVVDAEADTGLRHGGTWFAGVDCLRNDAQGRVDGGPPLRCEALAVAGSLPLHPAQISVTFRGYPGRDPGESEAAHRFRRNRDAAHLDGLLPVGPDRRRMIREPHAWILGLPLTPMCRTNAPLVVWEASHEPLRQALAEALAPHPPDSWPNVDLTQAYQDARRHCFETCKRVEIVAEPGQAILMHRLILHGMAPWSGPPGPPRSVLYFRPVLPGGVTDWLTLP